MTDIFDSHSAATECAECFSAFGMESVMANDPAVANSSASVQNGPPNAAVALFQKAHAKMVKKPSPGQVASAL